MNKKKIKKLLRYTCTGCGTCCSDTVVPVNDEDLRRIVRGTGKNPADIVKMYDSGEIDWGEDRDGWIILEKGRRILGLRKRKERCLFLNKKNRCRIYEHRPVTCRSFPYDIEVKDGVITSISLNDRVDCSVKKGGKMCSFSTITEVAVSEDADDACFYAKIDKWNTLTGIKRTKKNFLEFLGV